MNNKKGQVTIFVIIAILIIAGVVGYFIIRNTIGFGQQSTEFDPVYDSFRDCIDTTTRDALSIAGTKGGYIENPEFIPGSEYAPSSNQLDFVGIGIPYWYYLGNNGLLAQQVPSRRDIESQIGDYLENELVRCDFSLLRGEGFDVNNGEIEKVDVDIGERKVKVVVTSNLKVQRGESSGVKNKHEVEVSSKFGKFYELALRIYEEEANSAFLENYSVDVMYNYAPVTGSELSCSPLIWNPNEVVSDIKAGLNANINSIKLLGNDYDLDSKEDEYFVVDIEADEQVNFLYQEDWPMKVRIQGIENNAMMANPVGLEEGLGILGFCYVPYHFVYDIYHSVLIQIYNEEEIFQFPVSVIVEKSLPRNSELPIVNFESGNGLEEFCNYRNTDVGVVTFDSLLNPVEADVSYTCLNERCNIGKTEILGSDASLEGKFPQCINGIVEARAEGYVTGKQFLSTNEQTTTSIVLDKLYELDLSLVVGGLELDLRDSEGIAVVTFKSEYHSAVVPYPAQKKVKLSEGLYDVEVRVYSGSSLVIPGSVSQNCVDVPNPGILGFFGKTEEQCFTINLPSQTLKNALSAGGDINVFIFEDELSSSREVELSVNLLPSPTSLDQVQQNYQLVEVQNLGVDFK